MNFTYTFCFMFTKKLFTIFSFTLYILLSFFVRLWQQTRLIRSLFSFSECRFFPSCSDYFLESIRKNGLILGLMLSVKRLFRCNSLCEGGIDEVPQLVLGKNVKVMLKRNINYRIHPIHSVNPIGGEKVADGSFSLSEAL